MHAAPWTRNLFNNAQWVTSTTGPQYGSNDHVVAFYNLYAQGPHFRTIVEEQTKMITDTGLLQALDAVYYFSSGNEGSTFTMNETKYVHMEHTPDGSELHTLERLHAYCKTRPKTKVLYFHNKGSLHSSDSNTNFRRALDCFNLNPSCIEALDTYDTCGWRVSPHPMPHYSGNFFWATCTHISGLFDPAWYRTNNTFITLTNSQTECIASSGRYLAEAWIGSAPVFAPADCLPADVDATYLWGYEFNSAITASLCPNPTTRTFGHACGNASSLVALDKFLPTLDNLHGMMGRLRSWCDIDFYPEILARSQYWYGREPTTYMKWMEPTRKPPTIADGTPVRPQHSKQVYLYKDGVLHAIPSLQVFIKLGLDFDQVVVLKDYIIPRIPMGEDAS